MSSRADPHDAAAPAAWREVITFWFGAPPADAPRDEWFRKSETFDATIGGRFGVQVDEALTGGLQEWDAEPLGALARIVLLDQFTRNMFRGTARSFAGDALALQAARGLVARGDDRKLNGVMRWFAYLPFEHAEDLATQHESLRLFAALAAERPALADAHAWAMKHHDVIARFGRYPHRNAILGRASTAEELAFLGRPGSSF